MCEFKSGIILKGKCVVAEGNEDSHTTLLKNLHIEDTDENARRRFVRAELLPPDEEWWTDTSTWIFRVDQDILPDWFENDKGKYEQMFREAVAAWTKKHVIVGKEVDELSEGYYLLKDSTVKKLSGTVNVLMYKSTVYEMSGNSVVNSMINNSVVQKMYNNSTVQKMYDNSNVWETYNNSNVWEMYDNSVIQKMYNKSAVQRVYDNSVVQKMNDNSVVQKMYENSNVRKMYDNSVVQEMFDDSVVQEMFDDSVVQKMYENSTVQGMFDDSVILKMFGGSVVREIHDRALCISKKECKVYIAGDSVYALERK